MIKAVKFVSVPVRNQDQAIEFYTRGLGFKVVTDQPFSEKQRWIEMGIPGAETKLVLFTPDAHQDRIGTFSAISFVADNVESTYEDMTKRGVKFLQPPKKETWGTSAIFEDQDGNKFVLSSK
jgi:predicted enzyme related to lactoylglutathione lyase